MGDQIQSIRFRSPAIVHQRKNGYKVFLFHRLPESSAGTHPPDTHNCTNTSAQALMKNYMDRHRYTPILWQSVPHRYTQNKGD